MRAGNRFKILPQKKERDRWSNSGKILITIGSGWWGFSYTIFSNFVYLKFFIIRKIVDGTSAWSLYISGANKWKKLLQNRLTCYFLVVSSHYVVKAHLKSLITPETTRSGWKEGLWAGVTIPSHFLFANTWGDTSANPSRVQSSLQWVFLHPQNANHAQCFCWFTGE